MARENLENVRLKSLNDKEILIFDSQNRFLNASWGSSSKINMEPVFIEAVSKLYILNSGLKFLKNCRFLARMQNFSFLQRYAKGFVRFRVFVSVSKWPDYWPLYTKNIIVKTCL